MSNDLGTEMQDMKQNYEYIGFNTYACVLQAGFKQALKHYCKAYGEDLKGVKGRLNGYPKSYPSKVVFTYTYGWNTIETNCVPITIAIHSAETFLDKLKQHIKKDIV